MKKKGIITIIILAAIALLSICYITRTKGEVLGSMKLTCIEPTTSRSTFSFHGEAGDRIKFMFKADERDENLEVYLYDSQGNLVYELDNAKELKAFYTLDSSDEYTLVAEYSDYIGKFNIKAYKVE